MKKITKKNVKIRYNFIALKRTGIIHVHRVEKVFKCSSYPKAKKLKTDKKSSERKELIKKNLAKLGY